MSNDKKKLQVEMALEQFEKSSKFLVEAMKELKEIENYTNELKVNDNEAQSISNDEEIQFDFTKRILEAKEKSANRDEDEYMKVKIKKGNKIVSTNNPFEGVTLKCDLKKQLVNKGLTLTELSSIARIRYGTLRDMMMKPTSANIFNVIKICKVLNIEVNELFKITIDEDNEYKNQYIISE